MNNKFYISYKAAKLLKEKGYNEECDCVIDEDSDIYVCEYRMNQDLPEWKWSCLTKAEAIDWLESKGLIVDVNYYTSRGKWSANINRKGSWAYMAIGEYYLTRLEAEEAAIIEALKLL
jgi:hypothetical protein